MMYEELIQRLREESEIERWLQPHSANETPKLLDDAADAIEELQGRAKVLEKVADKWCEAVPKWIPVTDRLPEKEQCCLVVLNNRTVDFCFYTKRCGFGMYLAKKWAGANDEVTHWMPLPEPPKDENK